MVVDHIDHNGLNNTDGNLRVLTNAENQQNRKGAQYNNKTGMRGVSWHNGARKWRAELIINNKCIHLGLYDDMHDASNAAVAGRLKYMPFSNEIIG
jgi:hypothetical protein